MAGYLIGIDIGTGSTKALAIDFQGKIIDSAQVHYPTLNPQPGHCEQAPELIWQAFVKCVSRISKEKSSPVAIVLSAAMHSIIAVDKDGTPLMNMITWADNRSGDIATKIRQSSAGEMLYEQTGTPIHAMTPSCKLVWLRENLPSLFDSAAKFISIKEFIWFKFFRSFEVDHSIASATGLMDIELLEWNKNAMELSGVKESQLSNLVSTSYTRSDVSPEISELLAINRDTKFIIGASDGCLANLGSFAVQPGIAALTIGTSGAIRVASPKPIHDFKSMTFNYRLDEETFICGGPTNNGGAALKWYAGSFLKMPLETSDDYNTLLKSLKEITPSKNDPVFLPYLFGERAPVWNADASGMFFGMRAEHTQNHFTRAIIDGISFALFDIASHMTVGGLNITQVNVSGGFVRSSEWLQILANIFNKKICLVHADDASAIGAAYLGMKSLGVIRDFNALKPEVVTEFFPQPEYLEVYRHNFNRYRRLYPAFRNIMHINPNL